MVNGLFANRDPLDEIPARYRQDATPAAPAELTAEQRARAEAVALANLEALLTR